MLRLELTWVAGALVAIVIAAWLFRRYMKTRPTPEELERRRRDEVNGRGKLGDAEIIDVDGATVIFAYQVAGVSYEASQDVSSLEALLPNDLASIIGPVGVKFDPRNPANSIVVCESWSGVRR